MEYLSEYRNDRLVKDYLQRISEVVSRSWSIMEICGGQTHGMVKNGLLDLLPDEIQMIHGPGCPVCVTPLQLIDYAVELAHTPDVVLGSFGDMLRVPGSRESLLEARAKGAEIRLFYSPLDAVDYARNNPKREIVFFAVGFETTAPATALSVLQAANLGLQNYSVLGAHVRVPPAIQLLLEDGRTNIQGILGAGHVSTIMGTDEYQPICRAFHIPIVMTGFEPVDLLQGILKTVELLEDGKATVENQYSRAVRDSGNLQAKEMMQEVFEVVDRVWRGFGVIPESGYKIKDKYSIYDATKKFTVCVPAEKTCDSCIASEILKGLKKPPECLNFGQSCTPETPLGAPMVSSEGACAAYYQYYHIHQTF